MGYCNLGGVTYFLYLADYMGSGERRNLPSRVWGGSQLQAKLDHFEQLLCNFTIVTLKFETYVRTCGAKVCVS